jgi:hypothetical protein
MLTTIPRNTRNEIPSRAGEREYRSRSESRETRKALNATASQRVQRGTNRPPGKSKKNNMEQTDPTVCTPQTGNHQASWEEIRVIAAVGATVTVPNVTRNSEVSSAIRSSERRQKMSAPTANHTSWKTLSITTFRKA